MSFNVRSVSTWVVVLSIALNLFFIGGITARILRQPDFAPMPPGAGWILRDLDEETRERLLPQLRSFGDETRPLRGRMFRAQRQLNSLMIADPLNREAISDAFLELREANLAFQQASHEQTLKILSALTPEQRQQAMSFMRDRRNPMDRRDDRDRRPPDGRPGTRE